MKILDEIEEKIIHCRSIGREPEAVTLSEINYIELLLEVKLLTNIRPTGQFRLFGINVYRSYEVEPGKFIISF